jgi:hypothetical protein
MDRVKLVPDLSSCIETTARKAHSERMKLLLAGNQDDNHLKTELTILEQFLQTADFRKLRAESERYLIDGNKVEYILYIENDSIKYDFKIYSG